MQSFDIIDRTTKQFVRSYMADSRKGALEQHFAEVGGFDASVKAIGPQGPKDGLVKRKHQPQKVAPETDERILRRVRRQRRGQSGGRVTSLAANGRKASKGRAKKAAKRGRAKYLRTVLASAA